MFYLSRFRIRHILFCFIPVCLFVMPAVAEMHRGKMGGASLMDSPAGSDGVERRDADVQASGLTAVFPSHYTCEPIASPYASPYRYDGSSRRGDRNGGLHGGMDISLKEQRHWLLPMAKSLPGGREDGWRVIIFGCCTSLPIQASLSGLTPSISI